MQDNHRHLFEAVADLTCGNFPIPTGFFEDARKLGGKLIQIGLGRGRGQSGYWAIISSSLERVIG